MDKTVFKSGITIKQADRIPVVDYVGLISNQVNILYFFQSLDKLDHNNQGYCLSPPN